MSDEIGEIALVFYSGGDNMGQIANRMLIEVIFKAKEKLKENNIYVLHIENLISTTNRGSR